MSEKFLSVPYRITEESSARNYLRMVAQQLLDAAEKTPAGKLAPNLPQSTFVFGQGGQVKDADGELKPLWYCHMDLLSTDIALVQQFQEELKQWTKQKTGK